MARPKIDLLLPTQQIAFIYRVWTKKQVHGLTNNQASRTSFFSSPHFTCSLISTDLSP